MKNISFENFVFEVKFSLYLIRRVFVMHSSHLDLPYAILFTPYFAKIELRVYFRNVPASVAQLDAHPNGNQEVAGSTSAKVGNILTWRLITNYFLRSLSPFCLFKKGSYLLAKECTILVNRLED